jgi:rRNA maturation endonuclease Nob1
VGFEMAEVRPIDANALLECIRLAKEGCEEDGRVVGVAFANAMLNVLETDGAMPTIDYAPVRHGDWKKRKNWSKYVCSECSHEYEAVSNFCPNCGAKMGGGQGNA